MTRRIPASMLYVPSTPSRWLRMLTSLIDGAADNMCCQQWQRGPTPRLMTARIASISSADRRGGIETAKLSAAP